MIDRIKGVVSRFTAKFGPCYRSDCLFLNLKPVNNGTLKQKKVALPNWFLTKKTDKLPQLCA
jgi:hypothetical protein